MRDYYSFDVVQHLEKMMEKSYENIYSEEAEEREQSRRDYIALKVAIATVKTMYGESK